ncbi:PHP domain-containing protein [Neisseriaceae bacterium ESL0693]|nr:PHP domain-containing protein [Neisseriaceae bacterium ESL0693]
MSIDLHCHSYVSDGALAPADVVRHAHANGCTLLALTDHDHTGGLNEARQEANALGLSFVNGVEISVTWRGRTIHIVGLDFDEQHAGLQALLQQVRQGRLERLEAIAARLAQKGISGAYEGALSETIHPEMVSRTHIAAFLIKQGHVRNKAEAFRRYLGDGKCCGVRHQWADLATVIDMIRAAGGMAVIAHPMRYDLSATARRNLFSEFKALGGVAIEVHSGRMSANDRINYALLARQFEFLASSGSDFHREGDFGGGQLGACPDLPAECQPIWSHFRRKYQ